ncbi:hypothetical protein OKW35_010004 [Paraburkholderia sp. MM5477-R1]
MSRLSHRFAVWTRAIPSAKRHARTGLNQIEGAIVIGVGMALFEATMYDTRLHYPLDVILTCVRWYVIFVAPTSW